MLQGSPGGASKAAPAFKLQVVTTESGGWMERSVNGFMWEMIAETGKM